MAGKLDRLSLERVLSEVRREKGIDKAIIIEALTAALLTAARKKYGPRMELEAHFNPDLGELELFSFRTVVEKVRNEYTEIFFGEAQILDPEVKIGDSLGIKLETKNFGRIAAQTAKQVIIQKIRDAEGENIYQDFKDRKGEIIAGSVHRFNRGNIIINLGRTEAIIPPSEQVPRETYHQGDRLKACIIDIRKSTRDPQVVLSRTSPQFLVRLFELEVPEVSEGIVTIKSVAREPGIRSKIGVVSNDPDIDPVGACVGSKGSRVQGVVQELRGEKIDIIPWSDDSTKFVCNALLPAEISEVIIDEAEKAMEIIVEDDQLSLAIGKRGQNVRLAVKLTGWKIDIKSKSRVKEASEAAFQDLMAVPGIGTATAEMLFNEGFFSAKDLAAVSAEELMNVPGIGEKKAHNIKSAVVDYLQQLAEEKSRTPEAPEDPKQ